MAKRYTIQKCCRWCEHFVPRARMCVHGFSARPGMPLRRDATESCQHFELWAPAGGGVKEFQTEDRKGA